MYSTVHIYCIADVCDSMQIYIYIQNAVGSVLGGRGEGGHLKAFLWAETENPDKSGILAEIKTNGRLGLFTHSCPTSHTNQALDPGTEYPIRCQTQILTARRHGDQSQ